MDILTQAQGAFGANCYMVSTNEAALLIDVFELTQVVRDFINANREKQMMILTTHRHFDHVAGIYDARALSGAKVAVHQLDACGLENTKDSLADMFSVSQNTFKPDVLINDGDVINIGDIAVKVIHTPGHTEGSVCFIIENVIFSGDTLFRQSVGRVDFPAGSESELRNSLKKLFALNEDYTVYPGHYEPTTIFYEKKYNPYC